MLLYKAILIPRETASLGTIMKSIKLPEFWDETIDVGLNQLVVNENHNLTGSNDFWEAQNLYLISDDNVKEGSLIVRNGQLFEKRHRVTYYGDYVGHAEYTEKYRGEVIASTDWTCMKTPHIPPHLILEFIERYNSGEENIYLMYS